jgi:predicted permease
VVLVIGAGVLVRSLANRFTVDLGFDPANVLTAQFNLRGDKYADQDTRTATFERLLERIVAMPGVAGASVASIVPMSDKGQSTSFTVDDRPLPAPGEAPVADVRFVHHDYFAAMRIGLKAGRLLEEADRPGVPVAVVINETGAAQLWPNESAVGKRITMEWGDTLRAEIVGVVGDVRLRGPDEGASRTTLYWEYRQTGVPTDMSLVVRGDRAVPDIGPIRGLVGEVDPTLPLYNVSSMERLRSVTVAQSRFITFALALFSALALGLAALGVYGVMAHGVQQRSREIGVRLALGADRGAVVRMLLGEAARVVGPGLAIGLVAALGLSRFLRTLVFGVTPSDPVTVVAGLALIAGVALVACWLPARRGSAIAPAEAIRSD